LLRQNKTGLKKASMADLVTCCLLLVSNNPRSNFATVEEIFFCDADNPMHHGNIVLTQLYRLNSSSLNSCCTLKIALY
jgi:hypothetical protein